MFAHREIPEKKHKAIYALVHARVLVYEYAFLSVGNHRGQKSEFEPL